MNYTALKFISREVKDMNNLPVKFQKDIELKGFSPTQKQTGQMQKDSWSRASVQVKDSCNMAGDSA